MKQTKEKTKKRLVLLDAHAILHRAYHALPNFTSRKGEPTGGLYGLSAMLIKLVSELKPDYIVSCYDMAGPTFRHEAYEGYKAKRPRAEDDLIAQMNRSRDVFTAFGIPIYQKEGFEADDVIGTIVYETKGARKKEELEVIIASGDMDTLSLVDDRKVMVYTLKKGISDTILYDEKAVKERFGFGPELLADYKGLRGDPSDNIPGIRGIGEKTATELILAFGGIEDMYAKLKKDEKAFEKKGIKPRIIQLLKDNEEEALFSKTLASIRRDAPIDFSLPTKTWRDVLSIENVSALFQELDFRTLEDRLRNVLGERKGVAEEEKTMEGKPDPREVAETAIALWLVNSDITNPGLDDIMRHAQAKTFSEARKGILREIETLGLTRVYREIELPLIPILQKAERRGVLIDMPYLKDLSREYHKELDTLSERIWKQAGARFNINSPRQLGEVLFDKMGLTAKGLKKTEGGARSTRESELLKLEGSHPIITDILAFREFQKLVSTYIDNIPGMVDSEGALHTSFIQTGTTTGRMASENPNLQNVPIKGEHGARIRRAFVARKGFTLAALDYSQIELRVLAILSKDKDLTRIFKEGRDVHGAVAARVFNVSQEDVTKEMRRKAKTINFGIIYGMGITSLQKALGGTREEAQTFYNSYFDEFPGIARYLEDIKREAAKRGYTETLFGRRRYFEGITSNIPYIRAAAERMAVNAPLQGTATGDIIKLAIVKIETMLQEKKWSDKAFLLLQVHDELLYEIADGVAKEATLAIKKTMETVLEEEVPIIADASLGKRWGEMKPFVE
ncbi:MAG: hypothetical protein HY457_01260 [Parcubacteria group bacterium]|nr:hypothetical protein [Parcubacteria group bacterium]